MKKTLLALTLTATSAFAQPPAPPAATAQVDARFAAWIGCWRLEDDLAGTGARMCLTPEKGGVRMQTIIGTQRGIDELVIPDAVERPIADSDCKGTERAEWSADGARIFRNTAVTCGTEAARTIKSVAFMAAGPSWINVQMVRGSAGPDALRVQRYRRAANQQLADGSLAPQPESSLTRRTTPEATTWDVEDVIEASAKVPSEVVQAALTEVHHGFLMNRKTLVALADGGVNETVIDLMVALTYPKKFVVERRDSASTATGIVTGDGWFDPMLSPMLMGSALNNCYTPYGYGYRSYYSMCGMGYSPYYYDYLGYGYNYYPGGSWVNIGGLPPPTGVGTPQPDGRAINGHGYTQIRNRESEPTARVHSGGNGSAGGYSSGGGTASSGGYSSGSSSSGSSGGSGGGDSGARIAVPKGGGGE
jgi:hypothetical protein